MDRSKVLLEYIWIDFDSNLRSKIKILEQNEFDRLNIPVWNFDGSSTGQAKGTDSDVILQPCLNALYLNPFVNYMESYLVLCECINKDGTIHDTNHRNKLIETYNKCIEQEPIFGIEQEYVIFERHNSKHLRNPVLNGPTPFEYEPTPFKWISHDEPGFGPQGPYYCGVGGGVCFGREISEKHLELCLKAGLKICGTNAEVMASQWEYQIGPLEPVQLSDQIWISRYILHKISELYSCVISFHPKPYKGDWNGSGGHTNFSTKLMRDKNGIKEIEIACDKLSHTHTTHMEVYGKYNEERLSGLHETSSIDKFTWGISNRGCSIRIPLNVYKDKCGYLEDRRPASNLDPYLVCEKICSTVCLNNY